MPRPLANGESWSMRWPSSRSDAPAGAWSALPLRPPILHGSSHSEAVEELSWVVLVSGSIQLSEGLAGRAVWRDHRVPRRVLLVRVGGFEHRFLVVALGHYL